jgi:hypothetical protein
MRGQSHLILQEQNLLLVSTFFWKCDGSAKDGSITQGSSEKWKKWSGSDLFHNFTVLYYDFDTTT